MLSIDVSKNDARRTALKQRKEELVNASELLKRSAAIRQGLALREAERDLFEQINNSLAEKTSEINSLIDELPEDDSLESAAIRRQNLTRVKFLVAYCKRKGSLIVPSVKEFPSPKNKLNWYLPKPQPISVPWESKAPRSFA